MGFECRMGSNPGAGYCHERSMATNSTGERLSASVKGVDVRRAAGHLRVRPVDPEERAHPMNAFRAWGRIGMGLMAAVMGFLAWGPPATTTGQEEKGHRERHQGHELVFDVRSRADGKWSDPKTWEPERIPGAGDRVLISRGTDVLYDAQSDDVIRMVQVVGALRFSRDVDTRLSVGLLKVQNSDECTEDGFECDFEGVSPRGEPLGPRGGEPAVLEVGTLEHPIPAGRTAHIRLSYVEGMDPDDAPGVVCCSARMEIHGAPLSRTWVELGRPAAPGDTTVELAEEVRGWREGDEILLTAAARKPMGRTHRGRNDSVTSETRRLMRIDGRTLFLDRPLDHDHYGGGEYSSEAANLTRNVVIESADLSGERGHVLYHAFSRGGVSYARLAHLGKEGRLGRYALHFHLVGDSMRGSQVLGAAIVDSHNRWLTIHGTEYLVVRDCVGYQSVGHGFFLEDGTEVYNLLDRNLGVQAYRGKPLRGQVLPFDPNDGAAFWWANGRNTIVRNVACENDEYGFRYDMKASSSFSPTLPVATPDGSTEHVDVRTIAIWRFEDNETHSEGLYGLVVAANGDHQPDAPIDSESMLRHIRSVDWTGPDFRHPHRIRNLSIWEAHYAFRPHSPSMWMENVRIHRAVYGIYRPAFENQVYVNLHLSETGPEPFNRGMDDASAQNGKITVDGLRIEDRSGPDDRHPVVHMTDNDLTGQAECHFRNVLLDLAAQRRPVFNRGGSVRADPYLDDGVPYYIHDYFGPGRHALIVSEKARDLLNAEIDFRKLPPLTGDESLVAEVADVEWPELLDPVDDLPPATVITAVTPAGSQLKVSGVSHDNGEIETVFVNHTKARVVSSGAGVVDWEALIDRPSDDTIAAWAIDSTGNVESNAHRLAEGRE
jgi:hypothetical protein